MRAERHPKTGERLYHALRNEPTALQGLGCRRRKRMRPACCLACQMLLTSVLLHGAQAGEAERIKALERKLAEQTQTLEQQRLALTQLQARLAQLEARLGAAETAPAGTSPPTAAPPAAATPTAAAPS